MANDLEPNLNNPEPIPEDWGKDDAPKKSSKPKKSNKKPKRKKAPDYDDAALLASCPVTPIGESSSGHYVLISSSGIVRKLADYALNETGLDSLFGGDLTWPQAHFEMESNRKRDTEAAYDYKALRRWIMRMCVAAGPYDEDMPLRGVGVWSPMQKFQTIETEAGVKKIKNTPMVHCGDRIWYNNEWHPSGFVKDNAIYYTAPRIERFSDDISTTFMGYDLLATINMWNWREEKEHKEVSANVMLGLIGQALICGAINWKAHGLIVGAAGTGKTTLARLVSAVLGPAAQEGSNNFTESGIRQAITNQARALILDEMEADGSGGDRIDAVIEMLRQMSSGSGSTVKRGSASGSSMSFRLNGCALMFCILPPHLKPQDRGRILRLDLERLPSGEENKNKGTDIEAKILSLRQHSKAFRGRAILHFDRFVQTKIEYHRQMSGMGMESRICDQIATIMAGRDLLILDRIPEETELLDNINAFFPIIENIHAETQEESEGSDCLNHLMTSNLEAYGGGTKKTVAQVYCEAIGDINSSKHILAAAGLLVEQDDQKQYVICVANKHNQLERIFRGTSWENGGWVTALRYLKGARPAANSKRFSGIKQRCTIIPNEHLPIVEKLDQ